MHGGKPNSYAEEEQLETYIYDGTPIIFPTSTVHFHLIISNNVTTIGPDLFNDKIDYGVISIDIPEGLKTIEGCIFNRCAYLTTINVHQNNKYFSCVDGVLFNKDLTKLIFYPYGQNRYDLYYPFHCSSYWL